MDGNTPFIGENGNWWIGETDTGVKAAGIDGTDGEKGDKEMCIRDRKSSATANAAAEFLGLLGEITCCLLSCKRRSSS